MPLGIWIRVGPRKHVLGGVHTSGWRHLMNTTEPSMCGGDAALLSNYFDHLFTGVTIHLTPGVNFQDLQNRFLHAGCILVTQQFNSNKTLNETMQ